MSQIDRIPVSQLPSRYGIARSALYTRLKDLQLEPSKEGKKAYLNASQVQLLDDLHKHIQQGGITSDFLKQRQITEDDLSRTNQKRQQNKITVQDSPGQITLEASDLVALVEAIAKNLLPSSASRLSYLRELEEAGEKGWLLSTSELADLLGLTPKTVRDYGEQFSDAGFLFTRSGLRKGGEIAWAISKSEEVGNSTPPSSLSVKEAFSSDYDPDKDGN